MINLLNDPKTIDTSQPFATLMEHGHGSALPNISAENQGSINCTDITFLMDVFMAKKNLQI